MMNRSALFVDSVYFIAMFDPRDQWRNVAQPFADEFANRQVVTTDGIIAEFLAHFSRFGHDLRNRVAQHALGLRSSDQINVVTLTSELVETGIAVYGGEFRYSRLSLQDCISILVMRERGITDALTADREFSLAGVNVLMQAPTEGR